ncbi:MAG TPA: VOC family protein [Pyrinomonadaceae bacterium]|nr:VOC family protein [Pyrinomonadaceae bacterium]
MMRIESLGYIGVEASDPARWVSFATEILGAPLAAPDSDGTQFVRFDKRHHRLAIHPGTDGQLAYIGLELLNKQAFEEALGELDGAGVSYRQGAEQDCVRRRVSALVMLQDPDGIQLELFYGPRNSTESFQPTRDISGFVALGHAVLGVPGRKAAEMFYTKILGFRISDYIDFQYGDREVSAVFLHCADGRHHTIALADVGQGLHHIMVEVKDIDDVGRTFDLCRRAGVPIAQTIGRHTNDQMISFYMVTPSGFQIEYGYGGRIVDDATWQVTRLTEASRWGHEVLKGA